MFHTEVVTTDHGRGSKTGRPRLDRSPEFSEAFARILPALSEGKMSKGEAARRLGISRRSLTRYLQLAEATSTPRT